VAQLVVVEADNTVGNCIDRYSCEVVAAIGLRGDRAPANPFPFALAGAAPYPERRLKVKKQVYDRSTERHR
jgi:hypothetical protein